MFKKIFIIIICFFILPLNTFADEFIDNLTRILYEKHYVPMEFSQKILYSLNIDNKTIEKITAPKEALNWGRYKNIFITDERLKRAVDFLKEHFLLLDQVESELKVDKTVIVAIIAIESNFGLYRPVHYVGDALFTLAKEYPPRSPFFTRELISYVLLRYLDKTYDDNSIKGSYAGAIGLPQFMPSSILNYAVDYDNDCRIDLLNNWGDVFASIANYLNKNGWQYKEEVAEQVKKEHYMIVENVSPNNLDINLLVQNGYNIPKSKKIDTKKFYLNDNEYELWLTYKNFDVIKSYNKSDNYALTAYLIKKFIEDKKE
ncbi:MAG: lytic murein transglycosylase [Deferribacterales bacterium]